MAKPLITINNWENGMSSAYMGFQEFRGLNIEDRMGALTINRKTTKETQRRAMAREVQVPHYLSLLDLKDFDLPNKRQVLRNCVLPKIGLHILNESKVIEQPSLFN